MALPFAPKLVYNAGGTVLIFSQSSTLWTSDRQAIGGGSVSSAGVPEIYVIRKDSLIKLSLRFLESELASVITWVDWTFDNGSLGFFYYYPSQTNSTNYKSWLVTPKITEPYGFRRVTGTLNVLELDVEFRSATGGVNYDIPLTAASL